MVGRTARMVFGASVKAIVDHEAIIDSCSRVALGSVARLYQTNIKKRNWK